MKQYKIIFIIGLMVLIFPFLGIPQILVDWTLSLLGICLMAIAINFRLKSRVVEKQNSTFMESDLENVDEIKPEILEEGEYFEEDIMKKENE
jgi:hypothetical protein